ncbi:hypothetical protein [Prosthecobacter sp.]|nr:hypothetical protein [Prosthecobacter sp.]
MRSSSSLLTPSGTGFHPTERFQGIITRNATDFRNILPTMRIVEP